MTKSGAAARAASNRPTASPVTRLNARTAWSYAATASEVAPERECPWASWLMGSSRRGIFAPAEGAIHRLQAGLVELSHLAAHLIDRRQRLDHRRPRGDAGNPGHRLGIFRLDFLAEEHPRRAQPREGRDIGDRISAAPEIGRRREPALDHVERLARLGAIAVERIIC